MNYKVFYFFLFLLLLFGIFLIFFSYPREREMAFVYFRDRRYQESYDLYQYLYEEGNQKFNVIFPLVELNLLFGETKEAVEVMEQAVKEYPDIPKGRERLGELYKYDSRPGDYLTNLEIQVDENPNESQIKELVGLYSDLGLTDKMLQRYKELVDLGNREEEVLVTLAFLKANQQKLQESISILSLIPIENYQNPESVLLFIQLLLDVGDEKLAFSLSQRYLEKHKNSNIALLLASPFYEYGYPKNAFDLIAPYEDLITTNPELFSAFVLYGQDIGKRDQIFTILNDLFLQGVLPNVVLDNLLSLAISEDNHKTINLVLNEVDVNQFSEEVLLELLNWASVNKQFQIIDLTREEISAARINQSNVLKIAFFMSNKPSLEEFSYYFFDTLKERELTVQEKFELEEFLFNSSYIDAAKLVYNSITSLDGLSSSSIEAFTGIGIDLGEEEKVKILVDDQLEKREGSSIEATVGYSLLFLDAAEGNNQRVIDYVVNLPERKESLIEQLFSFALLKKNKDLSLFLGKLWYDTRPNVRSERGYIEALILNDLYIDAYPLISKFIEQNPGLVDLYESYLIVLDKISKEYPKLRDQFDSFLQAALENPDITNSTKAIWGYVLIESNEKEIAEKIFSYLAIQDDDKEEYVQALLTLWGENPTSKQIEWLMSRAKYFGVKAKTEVVLYLIFTAKKPCLIRGITSKKDLEDYDFSVAYLQGLLVIRGEIEFNCILLKTAEKVESVEKLMELAEIAYDYGSFEVALSLYQRVLFLAPDSDKAMQKLIYSAYLLSGYDYAFELLECYLSKSPEDYFAWFIYAQILFENGLVTESFCFFQETLMQISRLKEKDLEAKTTEVTALYRLQQRHQSLRLLNSYLSESPDSLTLAFEVAIKTEAAKYYSVAYNFLNSFLTTICQDLATYEPEQRNTEKS